MAERYEAQAVKRPSKVDMWLDSLDEGDRAFVLRIARDGDVSRLWRSLDVPPCSKSRFRERLREIVRSE